LKAVPVINEAHFERQVEVSIKGRELMLGVAHAYLADNDHNNTMVGTYGVNGSVFIASVPPRSMTTFFLE
jgi:glucosylceramidase